MLPGGAISPPSWPYRVTYAALRAAFSPRGVEARGLENVPSEGPVIVAANHVSLLDPPLVAVAMPSARFGRFVAKEELLGTPLLGPWLKACGVVPIARGRADMAAIRIALDVLAGGGCMVVFPEGTRARGGRPLRPKPGVGLLARESGAPVVPARVRGTESFFARGRLGVRFGVPLRYSGGGGREECQSFAQAVMDEIFKLG